MRAPLFGLTGGIASGKSTVASFLQQRGVGIIDADQIARQIVAPGTEGLAEVAKAFGQGVLQSDGSLDRAALGALVFSDPTRRRQLEALTHPRIRQASFAQAERLTQGGCALIGYEAALLVENGLSEGFRPLVVVTAEPPTQLLRLMQRNSLTESQARARLEAQLPQGKKVELADFVIDTSGSFDQVRQRTDEVLRGLIAWFGLSEALFATTR